MIFNDRLICKLCDIEIKGLRVYSIDDGKTFDCCWKCQQLNKEKRPINLNT